VVICLERGANELYMVPDDATATLLVPAYPGCRGKRPLNGYSSTCSMILQYDKLGLCLRARLKLIGSQLNLPQGTKKKLEMWANAQRDGRLAEYRWRLLFNAAKYG